jgi:hypothetical protein
VIVTQIMKARSRPTTIIMVVLAVVVVSLIATARTVGGAAAPAAAPTSSTATPTVPVPAPALVSGDATGASADTAAVVTGAVDAVDALDRASTGSEFGAAVLDRTTGQVAVGDDGATPFYAASVVKLYTVVDILNRVDTGAVTLTSADRTNIKRALSLSDDNAMDALWERFGGPATVQRTIDLVGLQDSAPPKDPSQWGEALISARDVVAVYDYVLKSMSPTSRDMIMNALDTAQDTGADGFNQAFGLLDPPRQAGVAAKQGWMWIGSEFDLHTTGLVGPDQRYAVAVLTKNPANRGSAAARKLVNTAAHDLVGPLTG